MSQNANDSSEGRRLHQLAEEGRERGEFLKALEYTDQATLAYEKDGDLLGLAEVQSSRQSTFKHLYRSTGKKEYLILEKHSAEAAVEIAQLSGINESLAIPYHNLGKYCLEAKEYKEASEWFAKAVQNLEQFPSKRHSRPAVLADIKGHLYAAQYFAGDKSALEKALKVLDDLKNSDEDSSYNKNVWVTGAHLRIAEMLMQDNPELAKKHIEDAERIIKNDNRLILRKQQYNLLMGKV